MTRAASAAASWLAAGCAWAGGLATACGPSGPCESGVTELSALRPDTIRAAPREMIDGWKTKLDTTRAACTAEKRASAMEKITEVEHAITMRSADFAIEDGARAATSASAAPVVPLVPITVRCTDVARDGGFVGLLPPGVPREVAGRMVAQAADAGVQAPPDEALVLGGRPVYLSARGAHLEGSAFEGNEFKVQQSLPWPAEAVAQGAIPAKIVAAKGPEALALAWVHDLRVFFATLDVASERWIGFAELPISGDDGGRDLVIADMAWGRASFGLVLRSERGFVIAEVLPSARSVRPAAIVRAFVAGTPRVAWDGERFVVAAGQANGEPSMGLWRAPDGAQPAQWLPLLDRVPEGGAIENLNGDLIAKDGAVHLAFRVLVPGTGWRTHLGHAVGAGQVSLETCP